MRTTEIRVAPRQIELREDKQAPALTGYAAVFDTLSDDLGGFRERVQAGAFTRTLKAGADVRALVDHDPGKIIGRNKAGTLRLKVDDVGLRVFIDPPDTTVGRDTVELVRRGDLSQMSFAFKTVTDAWHEESGVTVRELVDVDLFDVSVVAYPAYPDTSVASRGYVQFRNSAGFDAMQRARVERAAVLDSMLRRR